MSISVPKHTQTPNELFDKWLPEMSNAELRVTLVVIRKTLGWHKPQDEISLTQFQKASGLSRKAVVKGIEEAIQRGTIREAGTGARGVKLYAPIYEDDESNAKTNPGQKDTSVLSTPVERSTSVLSTPDKAATSVLSTHTKEKITTKEKKDSKKKDFTPVGVSNDFPPAFAQPIGPEPAPKKARPRNLVFDAISEHVFGIPDTTVLDGKEGGRVGKHERIAREAFQLCIGEDSPEVLALAIANYAKHIARQSNGWKQPSKSAETYKTDFKAYLLEVKETIVRRIQQDKQPPPPVDDSPVISPEEQQQVLNDLAELTAAKSANSKPEPREAA